VPFFLDLVVDGRLIRVLRWSERSCGSESGAPAPGKGVPFGTPAYHRGRSETSEEAAVDQGNWSTPYRARLGVRHRGITTDRDDYALDYVAASDLVGRSAGGLRVTV